MAGLDRMKRILDRSFRYVPSVETDIRATFRRERKRIAEEKKKADAIKIEAELKVTKLGRRDPK
jgi:hypothetical protein